MVMGLILIGVSDRKLGKYLFCTVADHNKIMSIINGEHNLVYVGYIYVGVSKNKPECGMMLSNFRSYV